MSHSFQSAQGLVIVHAAIIGPSGLATLRLALDTAALTTLIRPTMLAAVGFDPSRAQQRIQITTIHGLQSAPLVRIDALVSLGRRLDNCAVVAHPIPLSAGIDGLLGLDFFRGTQLTLDFRIGQILLA